MIQNPSVAGSGGGAELVTVSLKDSMLTYSTPCIYVNGQDLVSQQYGGGQSFQMNKNSLLYVWQSDSFQLDVEGACERISINPDGLQEEATNCYFVYGDVTISP